MRYLVKYAQRTNTCYLRACAIHEGYVDHAISKSWLGGVSAFSRLNLRHWLRKQGDEFQPTPLIGLFSHTAIRQEELPWQVGLGAGNAHSHNEDGRNELDYSFYFDIWKSQYARGMLMLRFQKSMHHQGG